jgi:hypothetical protein
MANEGEQRRHNEKKNLAEAASLRESRGARTSQCRYDNFIPWQCPVLLPQGN